MFQTASMRDFVQEYQHFSRASLTDKHVHLFLGNRAADADSVISALMYAFMQWNTKKAVDTVFLPVAFVSSLDLPLRAELKLLLSKVELSPQDLVLAETLFADKDRLELHKAKTVEITLLDHNALDKTFLDTLSIAVPNVVRILDHHSDNSAHSDTVTLQNRVIAFDESSQKALVGSCCTLLVEEALHNPKEPQQDTLQVTALPLLGVILLDTMNMDPVADKATERDRQAIAALQSRLSLTDTQRDAFYKALCDAKTDPALWEALSVCEALRFDYKAEIVGEKNNNNYNNNTVGFSSVLLPLHRFVAKPAFWDSLSRYFAAQRLQSLVVMGLTVKDDVPQRELLVVERRTCSLELTQHLQNTESLRLQSLPLSLPVEEESDFAAQHTVIAFSQGNVKMSRKQVLPLVKQFYQQ